MGAGQIPREFIQLLLSRTELVDLIDNRVPLRKKSSNNYFACCPFHHEKSASFSVSQTKQFYYCFGCGAHGNAIDFLMQYDRLSFPEAVEALAKQAGMEIPHQSNKITRPAISNTVYELMAAASKFYQTEIHKSENAITYLKQRGISGTIARDFELGFAPPGWNYLEQALSSFADCKKQLLEAGMLIKKDEGGYYDRFRERLMFPIHDRRGRIIGFGGRILNTGEPKYLNSPETPIFQKGHELYGLYQALKANRPLARALIVEGYMDVIALFQYGITYAVATLGTATTVHHLQRLSRYTSDITFCFDGDQAGRTAAWRALLVTLPMMRDDLQVRFMFLPEGEDPDTLIRKEGKEHFEERAQAALSLSSFFFQSLSAQANLSSMDGRARFVSLASGHLKQLPEGVFQKMMYEELAKRAKTDITQLIQKKKPPYYGRRAIPRARPPSALRSAITLLVQEPALAWQITNPLPPLTISGGAFLIELVENIKKNSLAHTGAVLEHWRDQKERSLLEKLAQLEHIVPENGIKNEFLGAIDQIKKLSYDQQIEDLLAKASKDGLSPEEKEHLYQLIHTKKQTAVETG